jgi:hypothetical protein
MYQWAKEFMPILRRAILQVEETYGVVPPGLSKVHRVMLRRVARERMNSKRPRRNKSRNRRGNHSIKYGVIVPRTPEKAKEIDRANGNNLWGDA